MRPAGPDPGTSSMLTPRSVARRRARGDDLMRPLEAATGFCCCGAGAEGAALSCSRFTSTTSGYSADDFFFVAFGSCSVRGLAPASPSPWIMARRPPTGTIVPASAETSVTTPSSSASRSRFTLSVSISTTGSPFFTASPWFLYQRTTFPSVMASPIFGMMISPIDSPPRLRAVHDLLDRAPDVVVVRHGHHLEVARVRHRNVLAGHARHRRVELIEHLLGDARRDLRGGSERLPLLLQHDGAVRLRDRRVRRHEVERTDRAKVDDFRFDAVFLRELFSGRQRELQHPAI